MTTKTPEQIEVQPYISAIRDLERIIAQETCGITGAIPEQEDTDLAVLFVKIINHEARYALSQNYSMILKMLDEMEADQ